MIRLILVALAFSVCVVPAQAAVEIQEVESPGGLKAWLVEEPSIPFVALELSFKGGGSLDKPGKRGVVNLMTALIEEGAGELDAQGFAKARESLAASFDFEAFRDSVSVSARFLNENQDEAVDLLALALSQPLFDQESIDRVRAQVVSNIESEAKEPNDIARSRFDALAFGDHPYATSINGTVESVNGLIRDDIVAAHQYAMSRDQVLIGVAGNISAEELGPLLDRLLAGLPEIGAPQPEQAEIALGGGVTVVPFATPQSVVLFGHEGLPRDHPDFFTAFVANQILGGSGRLSRLSEEIREKRGLTYGIGSYLVDFDLAELILGQAATDNARMAETIELVKVEWDRIAREGVTDDELESAKTYLTGSYPLRFDGNGPIAGILVGMQSVGLPVTYIETRNDRVNAVTREDIQTFASEFFDADALQFVVVGQPEGLMPAN